MNNSRIVCSQGHTRLKVCFSRHCESKIRTACQVFPDREWSGAAFYRINYLHGETSLTASFDDIEIHVIDFCLQDIGSPVYTEYELNEDVASYLANHMDTLSNVKVGLLHSHNRMNAFFSGTDLDTLHEQAAQCNNVLSIVVNNGGNYVAKFTQKESVHEIRTISTEVYQTISYNFLGEKNKNKEKPYNTRHDEVISDYFNVNIYDCDIHRPENVDIDEEFKKECLRKDKEIKAKRLSVKDVVIGKDINPLDDGFFGRKYLEDQERQYYQVDAMLNGLLYLSLNPGLCSTSHVIGNREYPYPVEMMFDRIEMDLESFISLWYDAFGMNASMLSKVIEKLALNSKLDAYVKEELIGALNDYLEYECYDK